jgi:hypothetical protein
MPVRLERPGRARGIRPLRLAFLVFLAVYGVVCIMDLKRGWLIQGVNLGVHETGHFVFAPFGEFMTALGGTLFQLIIPCMFLLYFLRRGDGFAVGVMLWWIAKNFWEISVYAGDAQARVLPLVGGGGHDWYYMLTELGWLQHTQLVAKVIHGIGVVVFGVGMYVGWRNVGGGRGGGFAPGCDTTSAVAVSESNPMR